MPALPDDDPRKWVYDLHTEIKHRILIKYLDPWITILGSASNHLAYVDGFAGRSSYATGEDSSPLRVLTQLGIRAVTSPGQKFTCHFVEANPSNFDDLEAAVKAHPAYVNGRVTCHLYKSTFSNASAAIIKDIRKNQQPSFFFVDPFGYDDPTMRVLREVLALSRAEVFINLMFNFAHRAVSIKDNLKLSSILDGLFGSPDWQLFAGQTGAERERSFMELYRRQLRSNGANHVLHFRMGDDKIRRTLYYLVHGTQHHKGGTLMKEVMVALASPGELGYSGEGRHTATPLFDFRQPDLATFLYHRYAGETISFEELMIQTLEDEETAICQEKDYRAAIRQLEQEKVAKITHVSTQYGLANRDRIAFALHRQASLFSQ